MNVVDAGDLGEVVEPHDALRRPLGLGLLQQRQRVGADAVALLVDVGRVEPEAGVLDLELAGVRVGGSL